MKRDAGFTLIEMMITVAIVAILASIAVPAYTEFMRRGAIADGLERLSEAKVRLEQYYASQRRYTTGAGTGVCGIDFSTLFGSTKFALDGATACTDATFTLSVTGNAGSNVAGFTYTVDQTGTQATTAGSYGTSTTCWIKRQGGSCS